MNTRILLVEDNAVSREFLHEALKPLAMTIDIADSLASARRLAEQHRHSLYLCDVNLPDGGPVEIYQSLKLLQARTTIVAITADASPMASAHLLDIGYQEVWGKPITMMALQGNVSRLMGSASGAAMTDAPMDIWDEASALRAVGNNRATLAALKNMFLLELPKQVKLIELAQKNGDMALLKGECHKLLASCGFVGATQLAYTVKQLSENHTDSFKLKAMTKQAERCLASG